MAWESGNRRHWWLQLRWVIVGSLAGLALSVLWSLALASGRSQGADQRSSNNSAASLPQASPEVRVDPRPHGALTAEPGGRTGQPPAASGDPAGRQAEGAAPRPDAQGVEILLEAGLELAQAFVEVDVASRSSLLSGRRREWLLAAGRSTFLQRPSPHELPSDGALRNAVIAQMVAREALRLGPTYGDRHTLEILVRLQEQRNRGVAETGMEIRRAFPSSDVPDKLYDLVAHSMRAAVGQSLDASASPAGDPDALIVALDHLAEAHAKRTQELKTIHAQAIDLCARLLSGEATRPLLDGADLDALLDMIEGILHATGSAEWPREFPLGMLDAYTRLFPVETPTRADGGSADRRRVDAFLKEVEKHLGRPLGEDARARLLHWLGRRA